MTRAVSEGAGTISGDSPKGAEDSSAGAVLAGAGALADSPAIVVLAIEQLPGQLWAVWGFQPGRGRFRVVLHDRLLSPMNVTIAAGVQAALYP